MPTTPNSQSTESNRTRGIVDSTELGYLPVRISAVLTTLAAIITIYIAMQMGVRSDVMLAVLASGVIAATGVRSAANSTRTRLTFISTFLLWISGGIFTIGTAVLLVESSPPAYITVIVACGAALTMFGIIGNTVESFGQGVSKRVVLDYVIGVGVLVAIGVLIGVVELLLNTVLAGGVSVLNSLSGNPIAGTSVFLRGGISIFVYGFFLAVLRRVVQSLPMEVLISGNAYGSVKKIQSLQKRIHETGLFVIGLYLLLVVGGVIVQTQTTHPIGGVIELIVSVVASPSAITIVISILAVLLLGVAVLTMTKRAAKITGERVVAILLPPFVVVVTAIITGGVFGGVVRDTISGTAVNGVIESNDAVAVLIESYLPVVLIGSVLPLLMVSVVLFSIPSLISRMNAVKSPVSGVITACIGVTVIVLCSVYTGGSVSVVLLGVVFTVLLWGVGEHGIVGTGELKPSEMRGVLPEVSGLHRVSAVHAVVVSVVGFVGFLLASGVVTVFSAATLPRSAAVVAVVVSSIGLIVLTEQI